MDAKVAWEGAVLSVQPRIRLTRSFDQRSHTYLGYALRVCGALAGEAREFIVAVGKAAHEKHEFRAGDRISGKSERVLDTRTEAADLYKASGLKLLARGPETSGDPPPLLGVPPALGVYREHAHRRPVEARLLSSASWALRRRGNTPRASSRGSHIVVSAGRPRVAGRPGMIQV